MSRSANVKKRRFFVRNNLVLHEVGFYPIQVAIIDTEPRFLPRNGLKIRRVKFFKEPITMNKHVHPVTTQVL